MNCISHVAAISMAAKRILTPIVITTAKIAYQNVFHQRPWMRAFDAFVAWKYFFHSKKYNGRERENDIAKNKNVPTASTIGTRARYSLKYAKPRANKKPITNITTNWIPTAKPVPAHDHIPLHDLISDLNV